MHANKPHTQQQQRNPQSPSKKTPNNKKNNNLNSYVSKTEDKRKKLSTYFLYFDWKDLRQTPPEVACYLSLPSGYTNPQPSVSDDNSALPLRTKAKAPK